MERQVKKVFIELTPEQVQQSNKGNDIEYLILITYLDDNKSFEYVTGRETAYCYLKDIIDDIDLDKTRVLVEADKVTLEGISAYEFMKHVGEKYFSYYDFNIEEYR